MRLFQVYSVISVTFCHNITYKQVYKTSWCVILIQILLSQLYNMPLAGSPLKWEWSFLILFHLLQLHLILCIDPHHKIAGRPSFKGGRYHNVAARWKFKPPKYLPIVNVRTGGTAIIGVHEVVGAQVTRRVTCSVYTESYLQHFHLLKVFKCSV